LLEDRFLNEQSPARLEDSISLQFYIRWIIIFQRNNLQERHVIRLLVFGLVMLGFLTACGSDPEQQSFSPNSAGNIEVITGRTLQIVTGQIIYVPAYSEVFYGTRDRTFQLGITLTIHNTDLEYPIIVQAVRYYDTDGVLVTNYVDQPVELDPLATIGFIVPENDQRGGFGANFIVEWGAEQPVHEPIVEAVMISTRGTQGISFISPGRILSQTEALAVTPTPAP
jgi:hypothetical protein